MHACESSSATVPQRSGPMHTPPFFLAGNQRSFRPSRSCGTRRSCSSPLTPCQPRFGSLLSGEKQTDRRWPPRTATFRCRSGLMLEMTLNRRRRGSTLISNPIRQSRFPEDFAANPQRVIVETEPRSDTPSRPPLQHELTQGLLAVTPSGPKDGGLVLLRGSHKLLERFFAETGGVKSDQSWGTLN